MPTATFDTANMGSDMNDRMPSNSGAKYKSLSKTVTGLKLRGLGQPVRKLDSK